VLPGGLLSHILPVVPSGSMLCVCWCVSAAAVYFDNPDLSVYHTRLAKEDGAKLVRVRCGWQERVPSVLQLCQSQTRDF
jgi:SPX domain protein involved in polyphosphate accumulation